MGLGFRGFRFRVEGLGPCCKSDVRKLPRTLLL